MLVLYLIIVFVLIVWKIIVSYKKHSFFNNGTNSNGLNKKYKAYWNDTLFNTGFGYVLIWFWPLIIIVQIIKHFTK